MAAHLPSRAGHLKTTVAMSHHPTLELPGGGGARPHGDAVAAPPRADDVFIDIEEDEEWVGLAALKLAVRWSSGGGEGGVPGMVSAVAVVCCC